MAEQTLASDIKEEKIQPEINADPVAEYAARIDAERDAKRAASAGGEQPKNLQEANEILKDQKPAEKTKEQIEVELKQTESEKKIAEINIKKEAIEKDLKLSNEEKQAAIKKLESVTKEKDWWENSEAPKADKTPTDESKTKEIETKLKSLEQKEAEYNKILNNEFLKAVKAGIDADKDPKTVINELKGIDADAMSMEQLYEMKLRKTVRLTEEDKVENKTIDDVVKEEMEEFKGFSRAKKARETDDVRNSIKEDENKRFSKYVTENEQKTKQDNEWRQKAIEGVNTFIESVKNKNYFGVQMTPSVVEKVNEMVAGGLTKSFYNQDGSYNAKFAFEQAAWAVPEVRNLIMENAKKKYLTQGREEALLEQQRPDGNFSLTKTTPAKKELGKNPTAAEVAKEMGFTS